LPKGAPSSIWNSPRFYPKIAVAYTQVATDDHHTLQEFRASVGAEWTFLSDPGRTIQKDLDIQEYTEPEHNSMIPHTLVIKPGLVIYSIYNGYWFWGRPSVIEPCPPGGRFS
jgi:peroxiredoxin